MTSTQPAIPEDIHLPGPSYNPILLAFGVVLLAAGVLLTPVISAVGLIVILVAVAGWVQENRLHAQQEETSHDEHA